MIRKDPDVIRLMYLLGFANKDELTIEDTHLNDVDTDTETEMERRSLPRDERIERIKSGIEHNIKAESDDSHGIEEEETNTFEWLK